MALPTKVATAPVDPWTTSKETWLFVTTPEEDLTGQKFPSIWLNKTEFKAGNTFQVPPQVAEYLNGRIKAYNHSVTRLFSSKVDMRALNDVAVGTSAPMAPSGDKPGYIDASKINTL
jgi:hypothetical protein